MLAISNLRKAAVLLKSLPDEQATELLSTLARDEALAVAEEIKTLGDLDATEQDQVISEFAGASANWANSRRAAEPPFRFLHDLDADALVALVGEEQPQAISLILSHLPPHLAAEVLAELPPKKQLAVICRMATMKDASREVLRDVEAGLRRRMQGADPEPDAAPGVTSVIRMFQAMAPEAERQVLDRMAAAAPELADEIRRAVFSIETDASDQREAARVAC